MKRRNPPTIIYNSYDNPRPAYFEIPRRYGFWNFALDVFMFYITCGVWIIWIFVREMRKR